jgi:hypothetical protein
MFGWFVKPTNPSPVQPLSAIQFPQVRINLGGPVIDPKRAQTIKLFDRSAPVPSLSEIYYTEGK